MLNKKISLCDNIARQYMSVMSAMCREGLWDEKENN